MSLNLKHLFTLSRGSRSVVPTVIVKYSREGTEGYGEASPLVRYGETVETVCTFIDGIGADLPGDPTDIPAIMDVLEARSGGDCAAKAAVEIALHDWNGKRTGTPVWKSLGLVPDASRRSSMTIGIDTPRIVEQKVREASVFSALKLKVGVAGDREFVSAVRKISRQPLRVDANEGWKSREEALGAIRRLEEEGVELVEQPLPAGNLADISWLRDRVNVPLIADEDFRREADLEQLSGIYDGVNIKLMKSTGLREAVSAARRAKSLGLSVMLGCMIESSVGTSAAAQMSPLADYIDLDGSLLIDNDPFCGRIQPDGSILLGEDPGIGVERRV